MFDKTRRFPFGRPIPTIPFAERKSDPDLRWNTAWGDGTERQLRGEITRVIRRPPAATAQARMPI